MFCNTFENIVKSTIFTIFCITIAIFTLGIIYDAEALQSMGCIMGVMLCLCIGMINSYKNQQKKKAKIRIVPNNNSFPFSKDGV